MLAPDHQQRLDALAKANVRRREIRDARVALKELPTHEGRLVLADLIEEGLSVFEGMSLWRAVSSVRSFGRVRMMRLFRLVDVVSGDRLVRELSDRQRRVLVGLLRGDAVDGRLL